MFSLISDLPRVYIPTEKEIDDFLSRGDSDIQIEISEEQMIPEEITFAEFFQTYQFKHLEKYGETLPLKVETPKYLKN